MGSLRNPVGPLPSSIYWRRRAVAAGLIVLLVALIVWFVSSGDDDPQKGSGGASASSPAPSITPGPKPSGPAISSGPGDASGSGGADDGDSGGGTGSGSGGEGADSGAGSATSGAGAPDSASTGSGSGSGSGTAAGRRVPADSALPDCAAGALQLALESAKVSYEPDEKPEFRIIARNTSGTTCKTDLGPAAAVLTISDDSDEEIWSSKDCPEDAPAMWVSVPAGGTVTHTVEWDRRPSDADKCETPSKRSADPGTYLAELAAPGQKLQRAAITLAKD